MEKEQLINLQIIFGRMNSVVGLASLVLLLERFAEGNSAIFPYYFLFLLAFIIGDRVLRWCKYFDNSDFLILCRYVSIVIVSIVMVYNNDVYIKIIAFSLYMMFVIEFISCFDESDNMMSFVSELLACIPLVVIECAYAIQKDYIKAGLVPIFIAYFITFFITVRVWNLHIKKILELEKKYFVKCRFIEDANLVNQQLIENQDKVKKFNEQLAYKKLQLESAYKKINDANTEIVLQNRILNLISSNHDTKRLLSLITEVIRTNMGAEVVAIILHEQEDEQNEVSCNIDTSFGMEYKNFLQNSVNEGCFKEFLVAAERIVVNQVRENEYCFIRKNEIGSFLFQPIIRNDEVVGALYVADSKYDMFLDSIPFYEAAVSSILIGIENTKLYERLENMAIKDELTGIYNRRYLKKICDRCIFESLRDKTPLTVALFDLDRFKKINDSYGHLFGDEALKMVAKTANDISRENHGITGRFGGEEFVCVFPNKNIADAYPIVEKIQQTVKGTELYHSGETVTIRLSIGIASFPETCFAPNSLLNNADWAMYYSKENGRDRITIDNDEIREQVRLK